MNVFTFSDNEMTDDSIFGPENDLNLNLDFSALIEIYSGFTVEFLLDYESLHANSIIVYKENDLSKVFESNNFSISPLSWRYTNETANKERFLITGWNQLNVPTSGAQWRQSPHKILDTVAGSSFTIGFEDRFENSSSVDWNDAIVIVRNIS